MHTVLVYQPVGGAVCASAHLDDSYCVADVGQVPLRCGQDAGAERAALRQQGQQPCPRFRGGLQALATTAMPA